MLRNKCYDHKMEKTPKRVTIERLFLLNISMWNTFDNRRHQNFISDQCLRFKLVISYIFQIIENWKAVLIYKIKCNPSYFT